MKSNTLNVIVVTNDCIAEQYQHIPAEQIGIQHISGSSIPNSVIRQASLVYYVMPDGADKPVNVLKNVWGKTGLMDVEQLQSEIIKCNRMA